MLRFGKKTFLGLCPWFAREQQVKQMKARMWGSFKYVCWRRRREVYRSCMEDRAQPAISWAVALFLPPQQSQELRSSLYLFNNHWQLRCSESTQEFGTFSTDVGPRHVFIFCLFVSGVLCQVVPQIWNVSLYKLQAESWICFLIEFSLIEWVCSCNFSVRVVLLTCGCCFVCFWVLLQFEAPVSDMQDNNTKQK